MIGVLILGSRGCLGSIVTVSTRLGRISMMHKPINQYPGYEVMFSISLNRHAELLDSGIVSWPPSHMGAVLGLPHRGFMSSRARARWWVLSVLFLCILKPLSNIA